MFIKICGLSTAETLTGAIDAGADAVGFLLAPGYPRTTTPGHVAALLPRVPDHVETVGVFRNQPLEVVLAGARAAGVGTVQLHGEEPPEFVDAAESAGFDTLRAFSASTFSAMPAAEREFWTRRRILLDAVNPGEGVPFDPALVEGGRPEGVWLLAGGLHAGNVAQLIAQLHPSGVDVSSGVETSRGVKSVARISEFARAARGASVTAPSAAGRPAGSRRGPGRRGRPG